MPNQYKRLTLNQEEFINEYFRNGYNGTQAYLKVYGKRGKSIKNANAATAASILLRNEKVKEEVERRRQANRLENSKNAADVVEMLSNIAFMDISEVLDIVDGQIEFKFESLGDLPKEIRRCIQSVRQVRNKLGDTIEIRFVDKMEALRLLARMFGLDRDNSGDGEQPSKLTDNQIKDRIAELLTKAGKVEENAKNA